MEKRQAKRQPSYVAGRPFSGALGLTLIETLVALVIMSVGLLGIAALHVESVKSARTATSRTKAVTLAVDMAEKMRANRAGTLVGDYLVDLGDNGANHDCADDDAGGATVACTAAQMAEHDVWLWKQRIANAQSGLPGGTEATITTDNAANPTFTISIAWVENQSDQAVALQIQP